MGLQPPPSSPTPLPSDKPGNGIAPGAASLDALTATKLWRNPCWFSFRFNYLGMRYNVPLYGWVERRFGLTRPEFVVVYSLGLMDGVTAKDIGVSSGFPKNTLSRAIKRLLKQGLISRTEDPADKRSLVLRLTKQGRAIFDEALPHFVELEEAMLAPLSPAEQALLSEILAKIVVGAASLPAEIEP